MRLLVFLVMLLFVAGGSFWAKAASPPEDPGMALSSVQADFNQQKHLKILSRPIVSHGTFAFQVPQSLRWEYRDPVPSVLLMHDGVLRKFVQRDGRMVEERGLQLGPLQVVMAQIGSWLRGDFVDSALFSVSRIDAATVRFIPKDEAVSTIINYIEIKIGSQAGLLDSVLIAEGPESFTLMTFSNRTLNRKLPVAIFTEP